MSDRVGYREGVRVALLLVVVLSARAVAGGQTYAEALRAGRQAEAAGNHAEAVTAFDRCVELAPADPTALGELGWAAFGARDLPKAEAATRKALAGKPAPAMRAALLYNLGRIGELTGNADVVPSYVESLHLRASEAARAHLRLLQPTLADAIDPFTTRPLAGPFASAAAACEGAPHTALDDTGHDFACTCGSVVRGRANIYDGRLAYDGDAVAGAPFEKALVRPRACVEQAERGVAGKLLEVVAVVQVGGKWFAGAIDSLDRNSHGGVLARITSLAVAGGQLRIDYSFGGNYQHRADDSTWRARAMVVIGVGSQGPALTHPIVFEQTGIRRGAASFDQIAIARTLAFDKDGAIHIEGAPDGLDKLNAHLGSALRGTHPLAFP